MTALATGQVDAFEIAGGIGIDDLRGDFRSAVGLEVRTNPLWSNRHGALGLAAALEADDDVWVGAGPLLLAPLSSRWRIELSVMLGWYHDGGGNHLGSDFPMFRSQIGVNYAVAELWRIGVAVNHKSNARTAQRNPGVETIYVTLARRF